MTFRPRICKKSAAIAKTMGRDGTKVNPLAVLRFGCDGLSYVDVVGFQGPREENVVY